MVKKGDSRANRPKRKRRPTYRVAACDGSTWNIVRLYPTGDGDATELEESLNLASPVEVDEEMLGAAVAAYFVRYEVVLLQRGSKKKRKPFRGDEVCGQTSTTFRSGGVIKTAAEHDAENRDDGAALLSYLTENREQRLIRLAPDGVVCYVPWTDEDTLLPPPPAIEQTTAPADNGHPGSEEIVTIEALRRTVLVTVFLRYDEHGALCEMMQEAPFGKDETRVAFADKAFAFYFADRVLLAEMAPDKGRLYEEVDPTQASPVYYRSDCRAMTGEELLRACPDNEGIRTFVGPNGGSFVMIPTELVPKGDKVFCRRLDPGDCVLSTAKKSLDSGDAATTGLGGMSN